MLAIGGQLVLGLPSEAWSAIDSVVAIGMFSLAALSMIFGPRPRETPVPTKAPASRPLELFLLHDVIGLTVNELATATEAVPSTVRGWLRGRHRPTGRRAQLLKALSDLAMELLVDLSAPEAAARLRQSETSRSA